MRAVGDRRGRAQHARWKGAICAQSSGASKRRPAAGEVLVELAPPRVERRARLDDPRRARARERLEHAVGSLVEVVQVGQAGGPATSSSSPSGLATRRVGEVGGVLGRGAIGEAPRGGARLRHRGAQGVAIGSLIAVSSVLRVLRAGIAATPPPSSRSRRRSRGARDRR